MIHSFLSDEYDDITFLELSGKVNSSEITELNKTITNLFENKRPFLIVDMGEVQTISGAILGELLEWRSIYHKELQGDLVITRSSSELEKYFQEMEADKVFTFFDDQESAVNFLNWEYQGLSENLIFSIPNQLTVVPALRNLVKKCVLGKGYSTREAFQIETIVDELCNNAIEHGNHGVEGVVEVALAIGRDKIEINIANGIEFINGEQSSPEAITRVMENFRDKPSSTIDNPRGRGLALVKMLASEFDIDSSDDGTCVHVTKYREV